MESINLNELNSKVESVDIFISSASFENRCLSLISSFDRKKIRKGLIFYNKNEEVILSENIEKLKDSFDNPEVFGLDSDHPVITANTFNEVFSNINEKIETLVVDTTTFTHEGLLILIKFLQINQEKFGKIFIGYVGAKEYSTDEIELEKKWLTKGIKNIRSVLGYPGLLKPSQKNHLIILFGFESERTSKLIENFEFDKVSLGFGPENDSISKDHYKINYERHLELLNVYPFAEKFEFSLTDPYEAKKQIVTQIKKFTNYNIVIAPLNNKLSTVGAALTALEIQEVQLCYVKAHQYNLFGYSKSSDSCFFIELKF